MKAFKSICGTVKEAKPIKIIFNNLSSIEPIKKNLNIIMERNMVNNKLSNITLFCKGLLSENKKFLLSLKFFTL